MTDNWRCEQGAVILDPLGTAVSSAGNHAANAGHPVFRRTFFRLKANSDIAYNYAQALGNGVRHSLRLINLA